jgi:hypothetical protein
MDIKKTDLADKGFKTAFLEGKLSIDCLSIKLTQQGSPQPRVYEAPGYLLVGPEIGVECRLVVKRGPDHPYEPFREFVQASKVAVGELIPDHHYYTLEATDAVGNVWRSPWVDVKFDQREAAEILSFVCSEIEAEVPAETGTDFVHFVFPEDLKLPLNRLTQTADLVRGQARTLNKKSICSGRVASLEVHYHRCEIESAEQTFELFASATGGEQAPEYFDLRLLEALRFCTATRASPVMSEISRAGKRVIRLAQRTPLNNNGLVPPPLAGRAEAEDIFELMTCYFLYACANASGEVAAPLSPQLEGLFTLKGVWFTTLALLVCVTAEGIAEDQLFKPLSTPSESELQAVQGIFEAIATADVDAGLIQRAQSAIGSMKSGRKQDSWFKLERIGALMNEEIKAWKDLRNGLAHGSLAIKDKELQKRINQVF